MGTQITKVIRVWQLQHTVCFHVAVLLFATDLQNSADYGDGTRRRHNDKTTEYDGPTVDDFTDLTFKYCNFQNISNETKGSDTERKNKNLKVVGWANDSKMSRDNLQEDAGSFLALSREIFLRYYFGWRAHPSCHIYNTYRGFFPGRSSGLSKKLTIRLRLRRHHILDLHSP